MKLITMTAITLALAGCSKPKDAPSTTWTTGAGSDYGTSDANVPSTSDTSGAPAGGNEPFGDIPQTPVDLASTYRGDAGTLRSGGDGEKKKMRNP